MKTLVWLLVVINVGLLAYFNLNRFMPTEPAVIRAEIAPNKIIVLSEQQIEALPKKQIEALPPSPYLVSATACYEWGLFSAASIKKAQRAVEKLAIHAIVKQPSQAQAKRFWIYKAPLKSNEEANKKALELKSMGIEDIYIVQEAKWKNAISFGIFEDETLAIKLMKELSDKGVKNLAKGLRSDEKGHENLFFDNIANTQAEAIKQLKPEFPEADLKETQCQ